MVTLQIVASNLFHILIELENMLQDPQDDGDAWISVEVPPEIVLYSDYGRGEAWARLRNAVRGKS
jgi:hypothetical protein